mgnify:CR=1 FL=1
MKEKLEMIEMVLNDLYCNLDDSEIAIYISEVLQIIDDILSNWEEE